MKSSKTFERDVWTVMGMPFDAVSQQGAADILLADMAAGRRNFFTTPNLDFVIEGLVDDAFRRSVLDSDLVVPDGMPIVWVAKLLGIPLNERVAGSSVFDAIREVEQSKPLKVFFFGGPEGVAEQACKVLEKAQGSVLPAGFHYPGFGTVADMSSEAVIQQINDSQCDFVLVALGAKKGQAWIEHNRLRLQAPVLSHLGAVVNFVAGSVSRAPEWMQRSGLEWVWRMLEERRLIKRYWHDGIEYLKIMYSNVLPYRRFLLSRKGEPAQVFSYESMPADQVQRFTLSGDAVLAYRDTFRDLCADALGSGQNVTLDCQQLNLIDTSCLGLLQLLESRLAMEGRSLKLKNVSSTVRQIVTWNLVEYLL